MDTKLLTHRQTADICHNLAPLIRAGFAPGDACQLLAQEESEEVRSFLLHLGASADAGNSLSETLLLSDRFPAASARLIMAGEQTGHLEEALTSAALYHENRIHTARQLRSALGYPVFLLSIMLCVVGVLLVRVLPVFASVYTSLGCSMIGIPAFLLKLGQILKQGFPVFLILLLLMAAAAAAVILYAPANKAVSRFYGKLLDDRWILREFLNARFLLALSMGIQSGLLPEESIALAADMMQHSPRAYARCCRCLCRIREGASFADALFEEKLVDQYGRKLLRVSSVSGSTDKTTDQLAQRAQQNAELHLQDILSKVEPTIVMVSSVLVGMILLSVMLPLMQVLSALG